MITALLVYLGLGLVAAIVLLIVELAGAVARKGGTVLVAGLLVAAGLLIIVLT